MRTSLFLYSKIRPDFPILKDEHDYWSSHLSVRCPSHYKFTCYSRYGFIVENVGTANLDGVILDTELKGLSLRIWWPECNFEKFFYFYKQRGQTIVQEKRAFLWGF